MSWKTDVKEEMILWYTNIRVCLGYAVAIWMRLTNRWIHPKSPTIQKIKILLAISIILQVLIYQYLYIFTKSQVSFIYEIIYYCPFFFRLPCYCTTRCSKSSLAKVTLIPLRLSWSFSSWPYQTLWIILDICADVIYLVDLTSNFFVAYMEDGSSKLVTDRQAITRYNFLSFQLVTLQ